MGLPPSSLDGKNGGKSLSKMGDDMVKCGTSMVYGTSFFGEHLLENTHMDTLNEYLWIYGN